MAFFEKDLSRAAQHLLEGALLTFPTETVYGVGCVFDSEKAYRDLVALKKRPPNKPFSLMAASLDMALPYLRPSPRCLEFLKKVLPGEITVLLPAASNLPEHVTLGTGIIGIRVPASGDVRTLISLVGKPCLVTSANISGCPTAKKKDDLAPVFYEKTMVIDGECDSLVPSTIVDASGEDLLLIRQGSLDFAGLTSIWKGA